MIMYIVAVRGTGLIEADCSNPITQRSKEVSRRTRVDPYSEDSAFRNEALVKRKGPIHPEHRTEATLDSERRPGR
jgi:hypothetical protein